MQLFFEYLQSLALPFAHPNLSTNRRPRIDLILPLPEYFRGLINVRPTQGHSLKKLLKSSLME